MHVIRILRELKRGGFTVKDGDVVDTVRQVKNTRHPDHIPITITFSTPEIKAEVLFAAAEIGLIGSRQYRRGDEEHGRIGFLRKSLTERERKNIRQNKEWRKSPQGKAYIEIRNREKNSRTDEDEWANIPLAEDLDSDRDSRVSTGSNATITNASKLAKALEREEAEHARTAL